MLSSSQHDWYEKEINLFVESYLINYSDYLQQADGEDELKKRQLMELAIINGTYRDSSSKSNSATGNHTE